MKIFDQSQFVSDPHPHLYLAGGCGYFGMNLAMLRYQRTLLFVDCGATFAEKWRLGIDAMIPGVYGHLENATDLGAYILTHGHEDHIGALPHFYKRRPAPIYGTPWTLALVRHKFAQHGISAESNFCEIKAGTTHRIGSIDVRWIPITHSIPMACAMTFRCGQSTIFHTGDFKLAQDPILGDKIDLEMFKDIGRQGVDLMLCDSTNTMSRGHNPGEKDVQTALRKWISESKGVAVVSTFSSNIERLVSVLEVAKQIGRRVAIIGRGMETAFEHGIKLGVIKDKSPVIDLAESGSYPRNELIFLATGCQGEWGAALHRIAHGGFKGIRLGKDDRLILSSRLIPGNERDIYELCSLFEWQGVEVITTRNDPALHSSGHAYPEEVALLIDSLKPKHYLPVHGSYSHLIANQAIAQRISSRGVWDMKVHLGENGDSFCLTPQGLVKEGSDLLDMWFIDSDSGIPIDRDQLRPRLKIGELGLAIISGVFHRNTGKWLVPPSITLMGIPLPGKVSREKWLGDRSQDLSNLINGLDYGQVTQENSNETARLFLRKTLFELTGKKPIVTSLLHIVSHGAP